jgi:hypothetical protein
MTASTQETVPPPPTYVTAPAQRHRPLGVTILAIIYLLLGVLIIISAIGVLVLAGYIGLVTIPPEVEQNIPQWFIGLVPIALAVTGVVLFVVGLISILIAWGFLKGRNWSRVLAIVLLFIAVVVTVFNTIVAAIFTTGALLGLIVSIIIPILLIWYLTTPKVKAWFKPGYYTSQPYTR